MDLTAKQREAVEATDKRILVLAGAGSGKTSVLVERILRLLRDGIREEQIVALTFTNRAAREMRERLHQTLPGCAVWMGTFHSFCLKILRQEIHILGYSRDFTVYDEEEITRVLRDLDKDAVRNALAVRRSGTLVAQDEVQRILETLEERLKLYNAVDFDGLLLLTKRLFQEHPSVLAKWRGKMRHLMVDEFQDTNGLQGQLTEMWVGSENSLFVVGDDDQSIYGWRGSEIKNILDFRADRTIKLEQNFRSRAPILSLANRVIAKNFGRHGKNLWTEATEGPPVERLHTRDESEEADLVMNRIQKMHRMEGVPYKEMAILYRSNMLSRPFEYAARRMNIPYRTYGGLSFYERSEIRDCLAYLRLLCNPTDQEEILRIINVPKRGLADRSIAILLEQKTTLFLTLERIARGELDLLTNRAKQGVCAFVQLIHSGQKLFAHQPLHTAMTAWLKEIEYEAFLRHDEKEDWAAKWENVQQFVELLKTYSETHTEPSLSDFLSEARLERDVHSEQSEDALSLLTFHSAKGLEFSSCFLVALESHLLPHSKSTSTEEERRLFYVALTRAKKNLILTTTRMRRCNGQMMPVYPSPFLTGLT